MKPGKLDLPTIWRGCDWGPVVLKWKDVNGDPANLSGWQIVAQSLNIDLNPSITDVESGETHLSLTKDDTAELKLGVESWDWIWQDENYRYPPFLAGKVEVKEPVSGTNGSSAPIPPNIPQAIAASSILNNRFTANWLAADRALGYRLDVSHSPTFVGFVPGFQNLDVHNVTSFPVTGLSPTTVYHYRLRAYNHGGTTQNSNVIHVTTLEPPPPVNDNFADNIVLQGLAGSKAGTTLGATRETAEPSGENSVWYRWRNPSSPISSAWRLENGINKISVYKGDTLATLVLVASSVGSPPALTFIAGADPNISFYRIRIHRNTGTGPFTLHWSYSI